MPEPAGNSYTRIADPAAVAATLADLCGRGEPVVLQQLSSGRRHNVLSVEIADDPPGLGWYLAGSGVAVPPGDMLRIEARRRAGHLASSAIRCDRVTPDAQSGRSMLRTPLPERLTLRHGRQGWRARVVSGDMIVETRITSPGAPAAHGVLIDLSVGGCRLALKNKAAPIEPGEPVNLRLVFPSADQWVFGARIVDSTQADDGTQLGLCFAGLSDEQERQLWRLTCEIDREAERRRRDRGGLRELAPSRLFEIV